MGGLGAGWASLGWALAPPRLGVSVNPIPAREGEIMHTPLLLAHPVLGSYWRPWFEFSDHDLSSDGHKIMKGFIFFVNSNFTLEIKKLRFLFLFKCHSVNLSQLSSLENCFSSIFHFLYDFNMYLNLNNEKKELLIKHEEKIWSLARMLRIINFQGRIPRKRYEIILIFMPLRFIKIIIKNSSNILWKHSQFKEWKNNT